MLVDIFKKLQGKFDYLIPILKANYIFLID